MLLAFSSPLNASPTAPFTAGLCMSASRCLTTMCFSLSFIFLSSNTLQIFDNSYPIQLASHSCTRSEDSGIRFLVKRLQSSIQSDIISCTQLHSKVHYGLPDQPTNRYASGLLVNWSLSAKDLLLRCRWIRNVSFMNSQPLIK